MAIQKNKLTKEIVTFLEKVAGNKRVSKLYKDKISKMSNKALKQWLLDLKEGRDCLGIIKPVGVKDEEPLSMERLTALAKVYDIALFQDWSSKVDGMEVAGNYPMLVLSLPVRRLSQAQQAKMSVPKNDKSIDSLTNQPTKMSTGAAMSDVEIDILAATGAEKTLKELTAVRGGDMGQYLAYKALLSNTGRVTLDSTKEYATGVQSSIVMRTIFASCLLNIG